MLRPPIHKIIYTQARLLQNLVHSTRASFLVGGFLFFIIVSILFLTQCTFSSQKEILTSSEREWLQAHQDELYFVPDPLYAPFEFYNFQTEQTEGLAYDYLKLVEKKIGIHFKVVTASNFAEILTLAKNKKIAIVNAVSATPEREEYLLFTQPYIEIENIIITHKNIREKLTLPDLRNKKIAVVSGYAVTEYLLKKYPDFHFTVFPSDQQALFSVVDRQTDAAILDIASASFLIDKRSISGLRIAGEAGFSNKLAIASRRDWPELNVILNKALSTIHTQEKDRIREKWIRFEQSNILKNKVFWLVILSILIIFLLIVMIIFLWNRTLQKEVTERTLELKKANEDLLSLNMVLHTSEVNLSKSLREKEVLIREVYHRTKNTLQIIRGLLVLQAENFSDNSDVRKVVDETELRIQSIALVHQMLYKSQDLSRISIKEYIHEFCDLTFQSLGVFKEIISLDIQVSDFPFLIDTAIPLGLILNELLTNSLKYAFPDYRRGSIRISLEKKDSGRVIFTYADNGIGVKEGFDFRSQNFLGLNLIHSIAEKQMQGTVVFENLKGISCIVEFPSSLYEERI